MIIETKVSAGEREIGEEDGTTSVATDLGAVERAGVLHESVVNQRAVAAAVELVYVRRGGGGGGVRVQRSSATVT